MGTIITILKKEILDTVRDRRTMITMVLVPLLIYPVLISLVTTIITEQESKASQQLLKIGLIDGGNSLRSWRDFMAEQRVELIPITEEDTSLIRRLISEDSLDAVLSFNPGFDREVDSLKTAEYRMYYQSTQNEFILSRLNRLNSQYNQMMFDQRVARLALEPHLLEPVKLVEKNLASNRQQMGEVIGGILPYFFIIFCLLGCMYPAIDMAAGEKERGTLETLLTSPANRLHIYLGKFIVVALSGFISAVVAILGLFLAVRLATDLPEEIIQAIMSILEADSIALLLSVLFPLTLFFAALMLTLSIYAKSFKEAQSMISPLMIVIFMPAIIAFLPGMELNNLTAWIPIFNVSLAAKEIISGTIEAGPLMIVYLSLLLLAALGILTSIRFFNNERNILRS